MNRMVCDNCSGRVRYREEYIGKKVRCPRCAHRFRLQPTLAGLAEKTQANGRDRQPSVPVPVPTAPSAPEPVATATAARARRGRVPVAWLVGAAAVVVLVSGGVAGWMTLRPPKPFALPAGGGYNYGYGEPVGVFHDDPKANTKVEPDALDLTFRDHQGGTVSLKQLRGKKNVVLVFMRGFGGAICPNCAAQTSRLISNYDDFAKRDAEVFVVFPGPSQHVGQFVQAARSQAAEAPVRFRILLDEDFKAVEHLGIKGDLAKPSTYLIDKQGEVRFAYVGATSSDRPSVKAMLQQLDGMK